MVHYEDGEIKGKWNLNTCKMGETTKILLSFLETIHCSILPDKRAMIG